MAFLGTYLFGTCNLGICSENVEIIHFGSLVSFFSFGSAVLFNEFSPFLFHISRNVLTPPIWPHCDLCGCFFCIPTFLCENCSSFRTSPFLCGV